MIGVSELLKSANYWVSELFKSVNYSISFNIWNTQLADFAKNQILNYSILDFLKFIMFTQP